MGMMDGYENRYNTELTSEEEKEFSSWVKSESEKQGRNILKDMEDYDVKGFWKSQTSIDERGHGSDLFKKPNHPTFSMGSQYHGADGMMGGKWSQTPTGQGQFHVGQSNMWNPENLRQYFNEVEPDVNLIFGAPLRTK